MAKPFSIQAPEDIAKEYAGNKQMIAQAAQMGVIDPTAAVLAGMFIDRMRSAQVMEAGQLPSVAQQVLGGQPPAPPAPPAGLGATPEAAAMPPMDAAPQMGPPPEMAPQEMAMPQDEMPMMAEGGMVSPYASGGGLSEVPLPDGMFDEPSNGGFGDGYAGGGMVAFADGGPTGGMSNLYNSVEYWESRGKQGAVSPKGARGVMQLMPGTMRDPGFGVTPMQADTEEENRRVGQEYLDAMYRKYGDQATALAAYNWGPGNVDKWLKRGGDPKKLPSETKKYISNVMKGTEPPIRKRDINTVEGQVASVEDIFGRLQQRFGPSEEERAARAKLTARAEELTSDEYQDKMRKDSMWQTLAAIGFNMASSKSPSLLQAIGEAASAALPGAVADKKERKALKDRGLELMVELGAKDRKEAIPLWNMATEAAKTNMQQQQFVVKQALDERQVAVAEKRLNEEIRMAGLTKPEDIKDRIDRYLLDFPEGSPQHEAAKRVYVAKNLSSSTTGVVDPKAIVEAGRQGATGFSEGQTAKDTKGRTIVFQGGQWVYP